MGRDYPAGRGSVSAASAAPRASVAAAAMVGVFGVPTIAIDDEVFWGDRLQDAAALLAKAPGA